MTDHLCDWCEKPATERIAMQTWRKCFDGKKRLFDTGHFLYACQGHEALAKERSTTFVSSADGSLADEIEAA